MDHFPLHRQQKINALEGSGTVGEHAGGLARTNCRRAVTAGKRPETWPALPADAVGAGHTERKSEKVLWVYVSAAGSERDIVMNDCCSGRVREYARAMLKGGRAPWW
ncbi:hypothetical protein CO704_25100 (plasmid) [Cedecea neteri]|uniref:Uncharacterized protein n=1 Tax=Cedecea neteri TaxID=158822 RepID=A0A291E5M5_9ENTR|nr:hypothetical protein CO704_25100 [Cedecea neteri]